ncbi:putative endo-beta-1,4-glucanase D [Grifola frondosa]|uniref:lytic cellulose monooxygenase (C4-dehydrogenating) n=1 Tax=Grifola frondosa TaxID=5627 RepID=A0A1C7MJ44_GRIFR|nr:putative endo-beta-1,4-glucanase D [Grifola frondosa]
MRPTSSSWLPEDVLPTPPSPPSDREKCKKTCTRKRIYRHLCLTMRHLLFHPRLSLRWGFQPLEYRAQGGRGFRSSKPPLLLARPSCPNVLIRRRANHRSRPQRKCVYFAPTKNASSVILASFRLPEIPSLTPSRRHIGALGGAGHLAAVESHFDPVHPSPDDTTVPSSQTQELDVSMASTTDSRKPTWDGCYIAESGEELTSYHLFCGSPSSHSEVVLSSQFLDDEVYLLGGPAYSRFSPATVPAASSKHIVDLVDRDIAPVSPATVQSSQSQEKELSIASSEALPGGHWPSSLKTSRICLSNTTLAQVRSNVITPNRRPLSAAGVDKLSGQIVAEEPIVEDIEDSESDIPVSTSPLHAPSSYNGTFDVQPYLRCLPNCAYFLTCSTTTIKRIEIKARAGAETQADFGETFSSAALDGAPRCARSMNGKILCRQDQILSGAGVSTVSIPAGATITFEWHQHAQRTGEDAISGGHKGPVQVYIAKAPTPQQHSTPKWATDVINANSGGYLRSGAISIVDAVFTGKHSVTILASSQPDNIFSVLRSSIALHIAETYPGAQFCIGCAQVDITGGGSASPPKIALPGAYKGSDLGITINIYNNLKCYTAPGGPVWSG